jgi:hypothetical protein
MTIHERLKAYAQETDTGGQIRTAIAALKTPLWAAHVASVQTIRHLDGTVVPVAIIKPGYEGATVSHGPVVGTWRSMVRAEIEGFGK